jgi:hypothetical protein
VITVCGGRINAVGISDATRLAVTFSDSNWVPSYAELRQVMRKNTARVELV